MDPLKSLKRKSLVVCPYELPTPLWGVSLVLTRVRVLSVS